MKALARIKGTMLTLIFRSIVSVSCLLFLVFCWTALIVSDLLKRKSEVAFPRLRSLKTSGIHPTTHEINFHENPSEPSLTNLLIAIVRSAFPDLIVRRVSELACELSRGPVDRVVKKLERVEF